jgi:cell division protease FtsH
MSDEVGPHFLGLGEQHVFLGRELAEERAISPEMLDRAEAAVQRLLGDALARARSLLVAHRDALDRLADRLLAEETLGQDEILAIIGAASRVEESRSRGVEELNPAWVAAAPAPA